jgi:hypothetical protein
MGSGNRESGRQQEMYNRANTMYPTGPTPNQQEFIPFSQEMANNYRNASTRAVGDYGNIMGGYQDLFSGNSPGKTFNYQSVSANRPKELGESYDTLRSALPGYRDFADTGGYSAQDIQELRARGTSPIRAAYGNTMQDLARANTLGGGAANYIAAASKAQRQLPGQMAEAMTGVNAKLAEDIRSGKLAGLAGVTGIGSTMGGLSSSEADRQLQAALANQRSDLTAQGMTEESNPNSFRNRLAALSGMNSLYGTTPGQASMFGNQALNAYGQRFSSDEAQNQYNLGLLNAQRGDINQQSQSTPWWRTLAKYGTMAAPYVAAPFTGGASLAFAPAAMTAGQAISSREAKYDIKPITSAYKKKLKELPLYTWKYKGDDTTHMGPIAEEFHEKFGIGDGKTLHLADVMGVMLGATKEALADA